MTNNDRIIAAAKKAGYSTKKEYHTYNEWQRLGYNVKRGSRSLFSAVVWYGKPVKICLFGENQVEPTEEKAAELWKIEEEKALEKEENKNRKAIRNFVRNCKVFISADDSKNIPDFNLYRRQHFGGVILCKSGMAIDSLYKELCEVFPGYFTDDITNPAEQLIYINDVISC